MGLSESQQEQGRAMAGVFLRRELALALELVPLFEVKQEDPDPVCCPWGTSSNQETKLDIGRS